MRTIGVITVGRSDYGIYLPVLRAIQKDPSLKLHLVVAGMHLIPQYGLTLDEIKKDGFEIAEIVELPVDSDSPLGIARAMGASVQAFAQSYSRFRPDILLVLGDRFEIHAAALAALPFKIPVAHIHGGELTFGAIDNALRHSITMLSHLHFVSCEEYARRVKQLGEASWRVQVTGAPALDHFADRSFPTLADLSKKLNLHLEQSPILVTYHPVTLEYENTEWQIDQLLETLALFDLPIVFTGTNADTSNKIIWEKIGAFVQKIPRAQLVPNFGPAHYFSMLANSAVMVGNSSSGLIEAPSFALPVVNIGSRQAGRVRAKNVIDVGYAKGEIGEGIKKALSQSFRDSLKGMTNPQGDGNSAEKIVSHLKEIPLDSKLLIKTFTDVL